MKKLFRKIARKADGFTLVELVVVIAILGILAGVAVPAYSGYLTKAKEASDMATLEAIKTAVIAAHAAEENAPTYISVANGNGADDILVGFAAGGASTNADEMEGDILANFELFYTEDTVVLNCSSAYWNGTEWTLS